MTAAQEATLGRLRSVRRVQGPAVGWRLPTLEALARLGHATVSRQADTWVAVWVPAQADVDAAAVEWLSRKARVAYPRRSGDGAGRWYPAAEERQECCGDIRSPSRAHPWSLLSHCCTAKHVAELCGVDVHTLQAAAKELDGFPRGLLAALDGLDPQARSVAISYAPTWQGTAEELHATVLAVTARPAA